MGHCHALAIMKLGTTAWLHCVRHTRKMLQKARNEARSCHSSNETDAVEIAVSYDIHSRNGHLQQIVVLAL